MKIKALTFVVLSLAITSCDRIKHFKETGDLEESTTYVAAPKDRAEELAMIRQYVKDNLPKKVIEAYPKKMEEVREYLAVEGQLVTIEEATTKSIIYEQEYNDLVYGAMNKGWSLEEVKERLGRLFQEEKAAKEKVKQQEYDSLRQVE